MKPQNSKPTTQGAIALSAFSIQQAADRAALEEVFSTVPHDLTFDQIIELLESERFPQSGEISELFEDSDPSFVADRLHDLSGSYQSFARQILAMRDRS